MPSDIKRGLNSRPKAATAAVIFSVSFIQQPASRRLAIVLKQRIERARQLLKQEDIGIAEIAYRCGFANQAHVTGLDTRSNLAKAAPLQFRRS